MSPAHAQTAGSPFRVVVVDDQTPGMDGLQLAAAMTRTPGFAGTLIMMLPSLGRADHAQRATAAGVAMSLTKPVRQLALKDTLLAALEHPAPVVDVPRPPVSPVRSAAAGRMRVLLAEDNLVNQRLAVAILEKQGHDVEIVHNGRNAARAAIDETFDVVLMDLQMPDVDGLTATRSIRRAERGTGRRVPIIALTAHAMASDRDACLAAGMDDYLAKPVRPAPLFAAIDAAEHLVTLERDLEQLERGLRALVETHQV